MNRPKTRTRARFRIIRANGKVEQHILIFDPAHYTHLKLTFLFNCIQATVSNKRGQNHPTEMSSE